MRTTSEKLARRRVPTLRRRRHPIAAAVLAAALIVADSAGGADGAPTLSRTRAKIVRSALDPLGIPYVWGGVNAERGLDCSGFALVIYRGAGLELPRTSAEQFGFTRYLEPDQVQRGDLVFFNMKLDPRKRVDHVGIYLGSGYFAHASFSRGIIVDRLSSDYYRERLRGVRRHPDLGSAPP